MLVYERGHSCYNATREWHIHNCAQLCACSLRDVVRVTAPTLTFQTGPLGHCKYLSTCSGNQYVSSLTSYRMQVRPIWPPSASMLPSSAMTSLGAAPERASLRTRFTGLAARSSASLRAASSSAYTHVSTPRHAAGSAYGMHV